MSNILDLELILNLLIIASASSIISTQFLEVFKFHLDSDRNYVLNWIWSKIATGAITFFFVNSFTNIHGNEVYWTMLFAIIGAEALYNEFIKEVEENA